MRINKRHVIELRIDEIPHALDSMVELLHTLTIKIEVATALLATLTTALSNDVGHNIYRIAETLEEKNK